LLIIKKDRLISKHYRVRINLWQSKCKINPKIIQN